LAFYSTTRCHFITAQIVINCKLEYTLQ